MVTHQTLHSNNFPIFLKINDLENSSGSDVAERLIIINVHFNELNFFSWKITSCLRNRFFLIFMREENLLKKLLTSGECLDVVEIFFFFLYFCSGIFDLLLGIAHRLIEFTFIAFIIAHRLIFSTSASAYHKNRPSYISINNKQFLQQNPQ